MKVFMALMGLEIGGAETHVVELCKELVRSGHNITVASSGGAYQKEIEDSGVKHIWAPMHLRNPLRIAQSFIIILYELIKNRPDVVHSHARIPAFLCSFLCKLLDIPFATSAHGTYNTAYGFKYVSHWGQKTLAVSEDIKTYLKENYAVKSENIIVSINGVDIEKFSPEKFFPETLDELNLAKDAPRMVYVSRLNDDVCNVAFIILDIFKELDRAIPGIELIIVGDGNVKDKLEKRATNINSELSRKAIVFTGARIDVNRYISIADLCIGVSRAALEGMAMCKPVIIGGIQGYMGVFRESILEQAIANNFTCRNCQPAYKEMLYDDILKVFSLTKTERKTLGEYGRNVVAKYYSVQKMAEDNIMLYKDTIHCNSYDVIISGYYGFRNSGDDSLLYAMIGLMKQKKNNIRILVLSLTPKETAELYGVDSINRFNVFKLANALRKSKLYINGGGTLITDITSTKSLIYYLTGIALAKRIGVKTMLYANGIGPVNRKINRARVKRVLNKTNYITLRDNESVEELKNLGVDKPLIKLTADPAFTLKVENFDSAKQLLAKAGLKEGERAVCISLRKWRGSPANLPDAVAEVADYIRDKYGLVPILLPMQYPYDAYISRSIISKMHGRVLFLDTRLDTDTILGIISMCDLVVAVRLHTLIYASALNVPAIGIAYDPKVSSFLEYTGQPHYIQPTDINSEKFIEIIDKCMENQDDIKLSLKKVTEIMRVKAEENADIAINLIDSE